jgi:hypothetical protein
MAKKMMASGIQLLVIDTENKFVSTGEPPGAREGRERGRRGDCGRRRWQLRRLRLLRGARDGASRRWQLQPPRARRNARPPAPPPAFPPQKALPRRSPRPRAASTTTCPTPTTPRSPPPRAPRWPTSSRERRGKARAGARRPRRGAPRAVPKTSSLPFRRRARTDAPRRRAAAPSGGGGGDGGGAPPAVWSVLLGASGRFSARVHPRPSAAQPCGCLNPVNKRETRVRLTAGCSQLRAAGWNGGPGVGRRRPQGCRPLLDKASCQAPAAAATAPRPAGAACERHSGRGARQPGAPVAPRRQRQWGAGRRPGRRPWCRRRPGARRRRRPLPRTPPRPNPLGRRPAYRSALP